MSITATRQSADNSGTVSRNFYWVGVENGATILSALALTILVARYFGPQRLGYFNFAYWLTNVTSLLGSLGIPAATCKYMSESVNAGRPGVARAVFFTSLRLQAGLAALVVLAGLAVVAATDNVQPAVSAVLVLSMLPNMLCFVPSQAMLAYESMRENTRAALVATALHLALVAAAVGFDLGLLGVAGSVLIARTVELSLKMHSALGRVRSAPPEPLPGETYRRLLRLSGQGSVLMLVQVVVWDRSDIVLLKFLQSDIRQVAFFSLAFSLVERLLVLPQTFGGAVAATQIAEYTRDRKRFLTLSAHAMKYAGLLAFPFLVGAAAVSPKIVNILYGERYLPVIPLFSLAALFAVGRALNGPGQALLTAAEDLGFLAKWGCLCAALNIGLDFLLIPRFAALGAVTANGVAQTVATLGLLLRCSRRQGLRLPFEALGKVLACSVASGLVAALLARSFGIWAGALLGIGGAMCVFSLLLRLTAALDGADAKRMQHMTRILPPAVAERLDRLIAFVALPARAPEASSL